MEATFERKQENRHRSVSCVLTSRMESVQLSSGNEVQRLHCKTIQRFLKSLGITGSKLRKAFKDLAEEAEQGSFWLRRKDKAWGKQGSYSWLQGAAGRHPYCFSTTLRCSRIKGAEHQ